MYLWLECVSSCEPNKSQHESKILSFSGGWILSPHNRPQGQGRRPPPGGLWVTSGHRSRFCLKSPRALIQRKKVCWQANACFHWQESVV